MCWLPWALFGVELLRDSFTALRLLFAGGAVALAAFAAHGQMFSLLVLIVVLYGGLASLLEWRDRGARPLLVAVATVRTRDDAEMFQELLRDAGVRAGISEQADGLAVLVFQRDLSRARALVSAH